MASGPPMIEKVLGENAVRDTGNGYQEVSLPPNAADDDDLDLETGQELEFVKVIDRCRDRKRITLELRPK